MQNKILLIFLLGALVSTSGCIDEVLEFLGLTSTTTTTTSLVEDYTTTTTTIGEVITTTSVPETTTTIITFNVATFNIEWLGKTTSTRKFPVSNVDDASGQPVVKENRSADDYERIANVTISLEADIICFQEVDLDGGSSDLAINEVLGIINQNHDFGLLPLDQPRAQDVGFLYNRDKFEVVGGISALSTFAGIGGRDPVIATFKLKGTKGGEDLQFMVICGHYKYPIKSADSDLQREQFEALRAWMDQNPSAKVIVLGDFNSDNDSTNRWVRAHANILYGYSGWMHIDGPLEDQGEYTAWESSRDNNFYDHIFISDEMNPYYTGRIEVFKFDELYRNAWGSDIYRVSNHRPLKAYFDP